MNFTSKVARRSFLKMTAFSLGCGSLTNAFQQLSAESKFDSQALSYGPLSAVEDQTTGLPLLELPEGFRYSTFCWSRDEMSDGTITPGAHDGMGVIQEDCGILTLCRNHELSGSTTAFGPSAIQYDQTMGGGCSMLQFDAGQGVWLNARPALSGTVRNCAGGPTPWNSWLSCEETVDGPVDESDSDELTHGWIFEVPAEGVANALPLKDMGRFVHEAIAVDPDTGIVYETEDRGTAGLYRFLPNTSGKLTDGGELQMLQVKGQLDLRKSDLVGVKHDCQWVTIEDPHRAHADSEKQDQLGCYTQGKAKGATTFARLEGCWYGNGLIYFDSTSGGPKSAGQIWQYNPKEEQLMLLFASPSNKVLDQPDNLAVSPRGGIVLCEDGRETPQRLHGLTPDGKLFTFARNNVQLQGERNGFKGDFRGSEWAGSTFSPDGKWLFVNLQTPGITFAITGPWGSGLL
ncbi:PhoX family protein [Planctomycetaceae bacterium]|jgi:uncharacterized protein|nr:PhoX family protein [Planctomycetaceae bacterium]MDC0262204.1 PhoX family protein [Planctomycetaceae bacterium]MDC0308086.1 PhoX family protein [Planctomycetaceae bacterium]MDG2391246.1 DUF839 domain-containing protein [Planctomycetaceae bacterium]